MNWLTDQLNDSGCTLGIWLNLGSSETAEMAAVAGFGWALLDMEHGSTGEQEVLRQIQVLSPTATAPIVRLPRGSSDRVHRILDYGASGLMAPMINSAEEARSFAQTLRYPPLGTRGVSRSCRAADYGKNRNYLHEANQGMVAIVQIETPASVEAADAIAAVDGVDVLFLGHTDLGLRLGCDGNPDAPALREAEAVVLAACVRHGKAAGMILKGERSLEDVRQQGFSVIALGSDIGCVRAGYQQLLSRR